jgi:hypothetical protein
MELWGPASTVTRTSIIRGSVALPGPDSPYASSTEPFDGIERLRVPVRRLNGALRWDQLKRRLNGALRWDFNPIEGLR